MGLQDPAIDTLANAQAVFAQVSRIAVTLSVDRISPILGTIGGEALIATRNLSRHTHLDQSLEAQVGHILQLLDTSQEVRLPHQRGIQT